MPRYKIIIEYDGTNLAGWQAQPDKYSVQEALKNSVLAATGESVDIIAAGRTDAGVHALGQVAHFDISNVWEEFKIKEALNFYLKQDKNSNIAVLDAKLVDETFHARYSAVKRYYLYRIVNRRSQLTLQRNRAWGVFEPLNEDYMHKAAQILVGQHDFTSFRSVQCQSKSAIKTIDEINVIRVKEEIIITCNAKSFLHHQVRNIVGSLKLVGSGKWQEKDLLNALQAKSRPKAGPTAPACGLYFVKVDY